MVSNARSVMDRCFKVNCFWRKRAEWKINVATNLIFNNRTGGKCYTISCTLLFSPWIMLSLFPLQIFRISDRFSLPFKESSHSSYLMISLHLLHCVPQSFKRRTIHWVFPPTVKHNLIANREKHITHHYITCGNKGGAWTPLFLVEFEPLRSR